MAHNFQGNFNTVFRPSILQFEQQQNQQQSHAMPQPTSMPWTIENMPWAQHNRLPMAHSQLMQFEAHANPDKLRSPLHVKRKSDINPTVTPPVKQLITEEKFAAHFKGLYISNNATSTDASSLSMEDALMDAAATTSNEYRVTAKELEEKLKNANRITLCEEVLKMHTAQNASILPEALINRIEKPCTALVLWQPPPILELLHRKNDQDLQKAKSTCNSNSNQKPTTPEDLIDDIEFAEAEVEDIDEFIDNNNTCNVDYNDVAQMDEDL